MQNRPVHLSGFFDRLLALLLSLFAVVPAPAAPSVLCRLQDDGLTEVSGLAVAGDRLLVHQDSGAAARFTALDRRCRTVATYDLAGIQARDWEDMAVAAGAVWLADTGDNRAVREHVLLHRVPLPTGGSATLRATTLTLTYPDGPHDAEALLVDPAGHALVVTKSFLGSAGVYRVPAASGEMTRVGEVSLGAVTGGAVSPDGSRIVLRTYSRAFEWPVVDGDVASALAGSPSETELPEERQGEAITYDTDGRSWLTTSEGAGAPVHRVPR